MKKYVILFGLVSFACFAMEEELNEFHSKNDLKVYQETVDLLDVYCRSRNVDYMGEKIKSVEKHIEHHANPIPFGYDMLCFKLKFDNREPIILSLSCLKEGSYNHKFSDKNIAMYAQFLEAERTASLSIIAYHLLKEKDPKDLTFLASEDNKNDIKVVYTDKNGAKQTQTFSMKDVITALKAQHDKSSTHIPRTSHQTILKQERKFAFIKGMAIVGIPVALYKLYTWATAEKKTEKSAHISKAPIITNK